VVGMSCALEMDSDKAKEQAKKMAQTVSILGKNISYKKYQKKVSKKPSVLGPVMQNFTILLLIIIVAVIFSLVVVE